MSFKEPIPFIEGERITLVPINFNHLDLYSKWENDPKIRKYSRNIIPITKESYEKYLRSLQKDLPDEVPFEIFHKIDRKPIGLCELSEIDWISQLCFVGIIIGERSYWGKSYCTDAVQLLAKYAFEELNLNKLKYAAFSPNTASLRCAEKSGFTYESTLKNEIYIDGQYFDSIYYTFTRIDWLKSRK